MLYFIFGLRTDGLSDNIATIHGTDADNAIVNASDWLSDQSPAFLGRFSGFRIVREIGYLPL